MKLRRFASVIRPHSCALLMNHLYEFMSHALCCAKDNLIYPWSWRCEHACKNSPLNVMQSASRLRGSRVWYIKCTKCGQTHVLNRAFSWQSLDSVKPSWERDPRIYGMVTEEPWVPGRTTDIESWPTEPLRACGYLFMF